MSSPAAREPVPGSVPGVDPPTRMVAPELPPVTEPNDDDELFRHGLEIRSRSQVELIIRRFLRHKLAMGSLVVLIGICLLSGFSSRFGIYDYKTIDAASVNAAEPETMRPGFAHPFGRDGLGRDVYARVLEGTRQSLKVGIGVALVSGLLGTLFGALAGFYRGRLDNFLMRVTDLALTLPTLAVLLVLSRLGPALRDGPFVLRPLGNILAARDANATMLVLSLLAWTSMARLVRGIFLSLREKEYVESARALGARSSRIIVKHLLPNAIGPVIVQSTLIVAAAILAETALSFLGFGIQTPNTSLGLMVTQAKDAFKFTPWEIWFPGLMIVAICLCINFVGDGLRDAVDPTGKKTG